VPRGRAAAGLDDKDSAVVGAQLPFPCETFLPEWQPSMSWASTASTRRRLRQGARLVVHPRNASPAAPVTTAKTTAAWRPAAGLCRARRCAGRTSAAVSGRSSMKQSGRNAYLLDEIRGEQNFGDIIGGEFRLAEGNAASPTRRGNRRDRPDHGESGKRARRSSIHGAIKTGRCNCGGVRLTFAGLWRRKSQCDSL